jgi:hypothetical protein
MALTPEMLEAAYEFLRTSEPFRRWKLPHADDIAFRITRHADRFGEFEAGDPPAISVSDRIVGHTQTLLMTLAHEMIHLRHHRLGARNDVEHGTRFRRDAAHVCRHHGWDAKAF